MFLFSPYFRDLHQTKKHNKCVLAFRCAKIRKKCDMGIFARAALQAVTIQNKIIETNSLKFVSCCYGPE